MQITAELVKEAFEDTGLEQAPGKFYIKEENKACGLGAVYVYLTGDFDAQGSDVSNFMKDNGLYCPTLWGTGFDQGVKGKDYSEKGSVMAPSLAGNKVGLAYRALVKEREVEYV